MIAWVELFKFRLVLLAVLILAVDDSVATVLFNSVTVFFDSMLTFLFAMSKLFQVLTLFFSSFACFLVISLGQLFWLFLGSGELVLMLSGPVRHRCLISHLVIVLSDVFRRVVAIISMRVMWVIMGINSSSVLCGPMVLAALIMVSPITTVVEIIIPLALDARVLRSITVVIGVALLVRHVVCVSRSVAAIFVVMEFLVAGADVLSSEGVVRDGCVLLKELGH